MKQITLKTLSSARPSATRAGSSVNTFSLCDASYSRKHGWELPFVKTRSLKRQRGKLKISSQEELLDFQIQQLRKRGGKVRVSKTAEKIFRAVIRMLMAGIEVRSRDIAELRGDTSAVLMEARLGDRCLPYRIPLAAALGDIVVLSELTSICIDDANAMLAGYLSRVSDLRIDVTEKFFVLNCDRRELQISVARMKRRAA